MSDSLTFTDEDLDRSIRRRAEYDDSNPRDLVLTIAKRSGGTITVPLLRNARSNLEREDYQENTLLRVKPLAEIADDLPVVSGYGAPVHQGKGVALLRPGYLYVFRGNSLWRELEISGSGLMSDIDLGSVRAAASNPQGSTRPSEGEWLADVLVPVFLQGQSVMHDMRMAYSEVQWDWSYIRRLEQDDRAREARTTGIGHAWAATVTEDLTFEKGFPAAAVENVSELRSRDLGIELMLENPRDFVPGFEAPGDDELCTKLGKLLKHNESVTPDAFDLSCEPGTDQLADIRSQKGLVCINIPDPLFKLRHSLAQLHLALHYLDAVDVSIQNNPMAHSAMLIRQAVFDPSPNGSPSALARYSEAIDRQKLDEVLDAEEKNHAIRVIEQHVDELRDLMKWRRLDPYFDDYRGCNDVAICEAYLLIADKLNVLQQIPGVLRA
ncbi:MAG: toxin VasX [Marinobacter sp.]|uniref:toxin VasX n=1 Tax=Marinobacter sp. TaxID=50741 RepID=UPI00299D8B3A|nr:toxin VasX [Marinobacter sp.]MDX1755329.1 toxin VasX [Marinobacter sp.]